MSELYIVATPIGNLEDITLRALEVLRSVDVIFCEDTRVTKRLLDKYDISTPTESLNARTEEKKVGRVLELLRSEKKIAIVSDAGTPAVSDPGTRLVSTIRGELPLTKIIPIPGASALTAAISVAGVRTAEFVFLGFLPHKKGRETLLLEIAESKRTAVFYESPHRLIKTLERLNEVLDHDRQVVVLRELTKIFEEIVFGDIGEVLTVFLNKESIKGEFVIVIEGKE